MCVLDWCDIDASNDALYQYDIAAITGLCQLDETYDKILRGEQYSKDSEDYESAIKDFVGLAQQASQKQIAHPIRLDILVDTCVFNTRIIDDLQKDKVVINTSRDEYITRTYFSEPNYTSPIPQLFPSVIAGAINCLSNPDYSTDPYYLINQEIDDLDRMYHVPSHFSVEEEAHVTTNFSSPTNDTGLGTESTPLDKNAIVMASNTCQAAMDTQTYPSEDMYLPIQTSSTEHDVYQQELYIGTHYTTQMALPTQGGDRYCDLGIQTLHDDIDSINQSVRKSLMKAKDRIFDSDSVAKRHKHNSMEKVRRKHVAQAFHKLASVLDLPGNKKPSKATILVKARERVVKIKDQIQHEYEKTHSLKDSREELIKKIIDLLK